MSKSRRTACRSYQKARTPAARAHTQKPGAHGFRTLKPEGVRGHGERRIVSQQRRQLIDVIPFKSGYVSIKHLFLRFSQWRRDRARVSIRESSARPLQCAIDGSDRRFERFRHFGDKTEPSTSNRRCSGETLESSDEREADALTQHCAFGRVGVRWYYTRIRNGFDPMFAWMLTNASVVAPAGRSSIGRARRPRSAS